MMSPSVGIVLATVAVVMIVGLRGSGALQPTRTHHRASSQSAFRLGPLRRTRTRRTHASDVDVADWCEDMARGLRSGSSLTTALTDSVDERAAVAPIVGEIVVQITRGRSLVDALRTGTNDPATPGGLALTVLRTCAEIGGPAAGPLERVAATLRARDAIRQEQHAHSAQAQMSARVMTLIPVGMLVLLAATDPRVRAAVTTPAGVSVVAMGATLNVVGWWWMQRIIGRPR
jgi:Flp pilus assembly protein TadB